MRHGPSRVATELSKACKILIFGRSLQPWTELRGTREQSGSGPIRSKSGVTQRVERGTQAINTDRQGPKASEFGAERRQRCKSQTKQGRRVFKSSLKQIKSQFHRDFTLKFSVRGTPSAVWIRAHPIKIRNHPTRGTKDTGHQHRPARAQSVTIRRRPPATM